MSALMLKNDKVEISLHDDRVMVVELLIPYNDLLTGERCYGCRRISGVFTLVPGVHKNSVQVHKDESQAFLDLVTPLLSTEDEHYKAATLLHTSVLISTAFGV